mgnify:CR=1 FL=1
MTRNELENLETNWNIINKELVKIKQNNTSFTNTIDFIIKTVCLSLCHEKMEVFIQEEQEREQEQEKEQDNK